MNISHEFHHDAIPVVGSCVTGRAWRAWEDGALTGVTYGQVWTVRGNLAHCPYIGLAKGGGAEVPDGWRHGYSFWSHGNVTNTRHRPGAMGCSCGMWSYHDLSMSASWIPGRYNASALGVVGIIHAYGLMTRGTKGYRSERADISALVRPSWADFTREDDGPSVDIWQRVAARYAVPVFESIEAASAAIHPKRSAA